MENVLSTIKDKVATTKVLAIIGVVLIIAGLFFNVGTLKFKVDKKAMKKELEAEMGDYKSVLGDDYVDKQLDELSKMAKRYDSKGTAMKCWGGFVMLIGGVAALALVYIDFVKAKLPEETVKKITFWDKLENRKAVWVPAILILVVLILTWQIPLKKDYADIRNIEYKEVKDSLKEAKDAHVKVNYMIGAGFVFIFLGAASLIAYPILYKPEITEATPAATPADEKAEGNE